MTSKQVIVVRNDLTNMVPTRDGGYIVAQMLNITDDKSIDYTITISNSNSRWFGTEERYHNSTYSLNQENMFAKSIAAFGSCCAHCWLMLLNAWFFAAPSGNCLA